MAKKKGLKHNTALRPNGDTILHVCAEYARTELFDFFYKKFSMNLDVVNHAGETPLIIAAREGRLQHIEFMHETYNYTAFDPNHTTKDGWTTFFYATINGYINTVEYLATTVKVDMHKTDRFKRNVVHWAARFNNVPMLECLIEHNINF